jgi:tetratricopeptide (TPR) repeat protein
MKYLDERSPIRSSLHVLLVVLVLVFAPPLGSQNPHDSVAFFSGDPSERYRAALRLGAAGDLRSARAELTAVLRADPTHPSARLRAKVLDDVDAGRVPAATAVHLFRASQHANEGRHSAAVAEGDTSVALSPSYDEAYRVRGRSHADAGDYERAIRDYGEAIRLNPANVHARINRSSIHVRRGEPAKAVQDLDEAIRRAPNDPEIYLNRGTVYALQGNPPQAHADLDRAILLDPGLALAYANKALLYERMGQRAEAVETLKALVRNARPAYASLIENAKAKIKELGGS